MDREPIALAVAHLMDVLAVHHHLARRRQIATSDELEQRGLAGTVRSHDTDHGGFIHLKIGLEIECDLLLEAAAGVLLTNFLYMQQRGTHAVLAFLPLPL